MRKIELTRGQWAIVDDDMYQVLKDTSWGARKRVYRGVITAYYAATSEWNKNGVKTYPMHHYIVGKPLNGFVVDHINGDTLDNRRENLRVVSCVENSWNNIKRRSGRTSSKYAGIFWRGNRSKWVASFRFNRKYHYVGMYSDEEDANNALKKAFLEVTGFLRT